MGTSEERRGLDWSQILPAVIASLITAGAGFGAGYWKAHTDAQATERAQSRVVRGSERAWRDDLYEAEAMLGLAIKNKRWTPEPETPLANIEDYKEISRAASWDTWRRLSSARDALDHLHRAWSRPRRLNAADVAQASDVLLFAEYARLDLARELDEGERNPAHHPIFHEAGLDDLLKKPLSTMSTTSRSRL
jgi:hypothetical protein